MKIWKSSPHVCTVLSMYFSCWSPLSLYCQVGAGVKPHLLGLIFRNCLYVVFPWSPCFPILLSAARLISFLTPKPSSSLTLGISTCPLCPWCLHVFTPTHSPAFSSLPQYLWTAGFCLEHSVQPHRQVPSVLPSLVQASLQGDALHSPSR